ncbi:MAG: fluoride efflux transporter CrcB [Luteitalea sp.]|nr:fluoride efflux transporter CrcB [Luteitalea sp.]
MNLFLVAIGGAIGSVARYVLSSTIARYVPSAFPLGTFTVNVPSCAVLGVIVGVAQPRLLAGAETRAFLLVGVLGGFTTFSTFAYESVLLLRAGQIAPALLNVAGQTALGVAALWAGYALALNTR